MGTAATSNFLLFTKQKPPFCVVKRFHVIYKSKLIGMETWEGLHLFLFSPAPVYLYTLFPLFIVSTCFMNESYIYTFSAIRKRSRCPKALLHLLQKSNKAASGLYLREF